MDTKNSCFPGVVQAEDKNTRLLIPEQRRQQLGHKYAHGDPPLSTLHWFPTRPRSNEAQIARGDCVCGKSLLSSPLHPDLDRRSPDVSERKRWHGQSSQEALLCCGGKRRALLSRGLSPRLRLDGRWSTVKRYSTSPIFPKS